MWFSRGLMSGKFTDLVVKPSVKEEVGKLGSFFCVTLVRQ